MAARNAGSGSWVAAQRRRRGRKVVAGANQWRSMWTHHSSRRRRRGFKPTLGVLVLIAGGTLATLWWSGSWIFKKPARPVELAATAAPVPVVDVTAGVPEGGAPPAPSPEDERPFEPVPRPETGPSWDRNLVDKAE